MRLLATCLGIILACVSLAIAQPPLQSNYYPLEIGHRWTYRAIDPNAPQPNADAKKKVVIEIEREAPYTEETLKDGTKIQKKFTGYLLKMTSGDKVTQDHVIVLPEGVHRIHASGTPMNPPLLFFKLDALKPGVSWNCNSVSGNTILKGTFTASIDDVTLHDVTIQKETMPKQTFKTYRISFTNNKKGEDAVEIDYWFAHDIGMIKQRVKARNHESVLELEKFEKGK